MFGALFSNGDRVQFAGHETFPLRLLWLKKAFDATEDGVPIGAFGAPEAIATFGVGRNMVASIRYWALASGIIIEDGKNIRPTELGRLLFSHNGLDPFLEDPATIWLAHWNVASTPELTTTAYYAFNGLNTLEFDAEALASELLELAQARGWRTTKGTLKRDVDVFLRSYARRATATQEDAVEPLLAELGLIREARLGGWFEFVRGEKRTLSNAVFAYAVASFWDRVGGNTLTVEQACYGPGSPGRVFKLDERAIVQRMTALPDLTSGAWQWTETAGLRQLQRIKKVAVLDLVSGAYRASDRRAAA